jgi:hypothetical protein
LTLNLIDYAKAEADSLNLATNIDEDLALIICIALHILSVPQRIVTGRVSPPTPQKRGNNFTIRNKQKSELVRYATKGTELQKGCGSSFA